MKTGMQVANALCRGWAELWRGWLRISQIWISQIKISRIKISQLRISRRSPRSLRLCESLALGERRFVAVVEFEQNRFLLGGTPSCLVLLSRLPDLTVQPEGEPGPAARFDTQRLEMHLAAEAGLGAAVDSMNLQSAKMERRAKC